MERAIVETVKPLVQLLGQGDEVPAQVALHTRRSPPHRINRPRLYILQLAATSSNVTTD